MAAAAGGGDSGKEVESKNAPAWTAVDRRIQDAFSKADFRRIADARRQMCV